MSADLVLPAHEADPQEAELPPVTGTASSSSSGIFYDDEGVIHELGPSCISDIDYINDMK